MNGFSFLEIHVLSVVYVVGFFFFLPYKLKFVLFSAQIVCCIVNSASFDQYPTAALQSSALLC